MYIDFQRNLNFYTLDSYCCPEAIVAAGNGDASEMVDLIVDLIEVGAEEPDLLPCSRRREVNPGGHHGEIVEYNRIFHHSHRGLDPNFDLLLLGQHQVDVT